MTDREMKLRYEIRCLEDLRKARKRLKSEIVDFGLFLTDPRRGNLPTMEKVNMTIAVYTALKADADEDARKEADLRIELDDLERIE